MVKLQAPTDNPELQLMEAVELTHEWKHQSELVLAQV
jgi:hypothetical protein